MNNSHRIHAVPTNIITGFLGVGKTSAILHLLKSKPSGERWAVLVNEFGEVGVDGSIFQGLHGEGQGVFVREVPGGCMCCASGLPMQIALSQLLRDAKPDRLLIEPTGLGHPKEVLEVLSADHYKNILDLQKILTLVDARQLSDERYTSHKTFIQQIDIADVVVANKLDLYQKDDKGKLEVYIEQHKAEDTPLVFTKNGKIEPSYLVGRTAAAANGHFHNSTEAKTLLAEISIPASGFLKAINEGEGFRSVGWRFSPDQVFDYKKLFSFMSGISSERMKAVFITECGVFGYNLTSDALTEVELDDCMESRVEIICDHVNPEWDERLMNCLLLDS